MSKIERVSAIPLNNKIKRDDTRGDNARERNKKFKEQIKNYNQKENESEEKRKEDKSSDEKEARHIIPKHPTRFSDPANTAIQRRRLGFDRDEKE